MNNKGFTLVELVIIMVVLGILAAVAVPRMGNTISSSEEAAEDSIIAAWWDYGYWITTLSDRTTIADNATLNDWQIKKIAYSLITTPQNSWHIFNSHYTEDVSEFLGEENIIDWGNESYEDYLLRQEEEIASGESELCEAISATDAMKLDVEPKSCFPVGAGLDSDYIVIFVAGERIAIPDSDLFFYNLDGGGDESKKHCSATLICLCTIQIFDSQNYCLNDTKNSVFIY